jgi:hypothetical protein
MASIINLCYRNLVLALVKTLMIVRHDVSPSNA